MKVALQTKFQRFHSKKPVSAIKFLSYFKHTCDLSRVHEGIKGWLLRDFMTDSTATAIIARLPVAEKI